MYECLYILQLGLVHARQRAYGLIIFTNERKGTHKDYNSFYLPPSLRHAVVLLA